MPTIKLGQVRPVYKGVWVDTASNYIAFDWVTHNGVAYIALKDVPANYQPDSQPDFWAVFGAKGADGAQGEDGADGAQGAAGKDGVQGEQGPQGEQGAIGPIGPQGTQGEIGPVGPAVPLSDSVTSASTTDAASSKAVKTAYDKGVEAVTAITKDAHTHTSYGKYRQYPIAKGARYMLGFQYSATGKRVQVWLDGVLCVEGDDFTLAQYKVASGVGPVGNFITWHDDIDTSHDIFARLL